jgi:hypothetical protein
MLPAVDTKDTAAVENEVAGAYRGMFAEADPGFVPRVFGWGRACFAGDCPGYQANDAQYHDLEHTMQGILCMTRLLEGRLRAGAKPVIGQKMFELGLMAMVFHDTGYLKQEQDREGSGAKYTLTHVARSVTFAEQFLSAQGLAIRDIRSVQNMIRCTGVHVDLTRVPFGSEVERLTGFALGTADLLGQMSAPDYVDKLPVLYAEFEESARFYDGKMTGTLTFSSAADLIQRTPSFWMQYVLPKLENEFWGLYRFLNDPFPNGPNGYVLAVEANMERLRQQGAR